MVTGNGRKAAIRWQKPEQLLVAIDEDKPSRKK
jgi:hypothetical protein